MDQVAPCVTSSHHIISALTNSMGDREVDAAAALIFAFSHPSSAGCVDTTSRTTTTTDALVPGSNCFDTESSRSIEVPLKKRSKFSHFMHHHHHYHDANSHATADSSIGSSPPPSANSDPEHSPFPSPHLTASSSSSPFTRSPNQSGHHVPSLSDEDGELLDFDLDFDEEEDGDESFYELDDDDDDDNDYDDDNDDNSDDDKSYTPTTRKRKCAPKPRTTAAFSNKILKANNPNSKKRSFSTEGDEDGYDSDINDNSPSAHHLSQSLMKKRLISLSSSTGTSHLDPIITTTATTKKVIERPASELVVGDRPCIPVVHTMKGGKKIVQVKLRGNRKENIEVDARGQITAPITLGCLTVYKLGEIKWEQPGYHNDRYIFPVGFKSSRSYFSMVNPSKKCLYYCEILDGGDQPEFKVTAADDPENPITSNTATGAWTVVVRRVNEARGNKGKRAYTTCSGPEMYGLSSILISQLICNLPNAIKCSAYKYRERKR